MIVLTDVLQERYDLTRTEFGKPDDGALGATVTSLSPST